MGRRGPLPQPTPLRMLRGNPGKRPINESEPKPKPIAPKCPSWLDKVAKREWKRVAGELEGLGLLTVVDGTALACYCQAYSDLVAAREILKDKPNMTMTTPNGYEQERPEVSIARKSMQIIRAFCAEFGLTPAARSRMQVPQPEKTPDKYEEYRHRGQAIKGQ